MTISKTDKAYLPAFLFVFVCCFISVSSDLPVHCRRYDVAGEWDVYFGFYPLDPKSQRSDPNCGYPAPDDEHVNLAENGYLQDIIGPISVTLHEDSLKVDIDIPEENEFESAFIPSSFSFLQETETDTKHNKNFVENKQKSVSKHKHRSFSRHKDQATTDPLQLQKRILKLLRDQLNKEKFWTTIYDEAVQISIGDIQLFAYMGYEYKEGIQYKAESTPDDTNSLCGETLVGIATFRMDNSSQDEASESEALPDVPRVFACWYGQQKTGRGRKGSKRPPRTGLPIHPLKSTEPYHVWRGKEVKEKLEKIQKVNSLVNEKADDMKLFEESTFPVGFYMKSEVDYIETQKVNGKMQVPRNFNWALFVYQNKVHSIVSPTTDQGSCGQCYTVAAISAMEAQLKMLYKLPDGDGSLLGGLEELSVEEALYCTPYNQGCAGGYAYLVAKQLNMGGVHSKKCVEDVKRTFKVSKSQICRYLHGNQWEPFEYGTSSSIEDGFKGDLPTSCNEVARVSQYSYGGGAYQMANAKEMMLNLFINGPTVASLEPNDAFMVYREGVIEGMNKKLSKNQQQIVKNVFPVSGAVSFLSVRDNGAGKVGPGGTLNGDVAKLLEDIVGTKIRNEWLKVSHSIYVTGFGEKQNYVENEEYWIGLNSWGKDWGNGGFFLIARGANVLRIESISVDFTVHVERNGQIVPAKTLNRNDLVGLDPFRMQEGEKLKRPPMRKEQLPKNIELKKYYSDYVFI